MTNDIIKAIAVTPTTIYLGGFFTRIGPSTTTTGWLTRNHLAALDLKTGQATDWNPDADSVVKCIAVSGSTVYVGGAFSNIGGKGRKAVAAIDAETGALRGWAPNLIYYTYPYSGTPQSWSPMVSSIAVADGVVYVAGDFTNIGGRESCYLAALSAETGLLARDIGLKRRVIDYPSGQWQLYYNPMVYDILATQGSAFITGTILYRSPYKLYDDSILSAIGPAIQWEAIDSGIFQTLVATDTKLYCGGQMGIRIVDLATGTSITPGWNFTPNGISSMAIRGTTLYVAGSFFSIGNQPRRNLAAIDLKTGHLTPWNPDAGQIITIATSKTAVYAAGFPPATFAQFDICTTPTITAQPVPQVIDRGTTASFNVTASGQELTYRWCRDGISLQNDGRISGTDSPALVIAATDVADAGFYSCRIENAAGTCMTSPARLTILLPSASRIWLPYR